MAFRTPPAASLRRITPLGKIAISRGVTGGKLGVAFASVTVLGVKEAIAKLRLAGSVTALGVGKMTMDTAKRIATRMKQEVPVVSGDLQRGISYTKRGLYDWEVTASSVAGGSDREYASYVEYGTYKMAPRPYMRPALSEGRQGLLEGLRNLAVTVERL